MMSCNCKECEGYINPIKLHDHTLVCKLQAENKRLKEDNLWLSTRYQDAEDKFNAENKRLMEALENIEEYTIGVDDYSIANAIFNEIYSARLALTKEGE